MLQCASKFIVPLRLFKAANADKTQIFFNGKDIIVCDVCIHNATDNSWEKIHSL